MQRGTVEEQRKLNEGVFDNFPKFSYYDERFVTTQTLLELLSRADMLDRFVGRFQNYELAAFAFLPAVWANLRIPSASSAKTAVQYPRFFSRLRDETRENREIL